MQYIKKKLSRNIIYFIYISYNNLFIINFSESQVYQFWVRATDRGVPFQQSDVSVEIYIVSPNDEIPMFDIIHDKYFVVENSIQGKHRNSNFYKIAQSIKTIKKGKNINDFFLQEQL